MVDWLFSFLEVHNVWYIVESNGKLQRPYLNNFDATGSPCHELTSWNNSSSMSI
jgi:hypothetical protein